MKRLFQIITLIVVALIIMTVVSLYPRLKNMGSEYATAQAIRDIEAYLLELPRKSGHGKASPIGLSLG
ncbi:MAG: hypothetical protein AB7Q64_24170 [Verrucomicrobiales bacterium]